MFFALRLFLILGLFLSIQVLTFSYIKYNKYSILQVIGLTSIPLILFISTYFVVIVKNTDYNFYLVIGLLVNLIMLAIGTNFKKLGSKNYVIINTFTSLTIIGLITYYSAFTLKYYNSYIMVVASTIILTMVISSIKHLKHSILKRIVSYYTVSIILLYINFHITTNVFALLLISLGQIRLLNLLKRQHSSSFNTLIKEKETLIANFKKDVEKATKRNTFLNELSKSKLEDEAKYDQLTRALNRKSMIKATDKMVYSPETRFFSMLVFDIDKFKTINDKLGHGVGDECLKQLVDLAYSTLRGGDIVARYGGDEFVILMPNTNCENSVLVANRFRQLINNKTKPNFTISVGLSMYPEDGHNFKALFEVADKGLYVAKGSGRNKVAYEGKIKPDDQKEKPQMTS